MTSNKLKIIAVTLMLIDHVASAFLTQYDTLYIILRFIGRFAAPIFCFLIAEGYHYTKDKKKYFFRLLFFAVISHIPFVLLKGYEIFPITKTSIMWPLTLGLLALIIVKSPKIHLALKFALIIVICLAADYGDWNFVPVLWILTFGYYHNKKLLQFICFTAIGWIYYIVPIVEPVGFIPDELLVNYSVYGIFGAWLFIYFYNGKLGVKSTPLSIFFYLFYPAHILVLYLIKNALIS